MKKIVSIFLSALMLASMLTIAANAATQYGTVVEIPYAETAPSMDNAFPDASWGEKIITIDKNSPNAGITQYKSVARYGGVVKQDLSFDMYACWTNDKLYFCFVSPDPDIRGGFRFWWGDGFQMVIVPGNVDVSARNGQQMGWETDDEYEEWDWCVTFGSDDETPSTSIVAEDNSTIYADDARGVVVAKFAMPAVELGYRKNESLKAGDNFSFSMLRIDGSDQDTEEYYVGWLEWGNFFDGSKLSIPNDTSRYVPASENTKTTTANTFVLVNGKGTTPVQQEDPTPLKGAPSVWAEAEVKKAIEAGLVPEALQNNYTSGISRANLSKILSALLDKVYGKAPEKNDAKFNDTTDADVLKAANLGIINGYDVAGGTKDFKPNNTLKRSEMTAIINRVAKLCGKTVEGFDSEVKFSDTASHWCNKELGWAVHNGIVKGTSATTFSPENTLTVEQTIMMICRTYEALK